MTAGEERTEFQVAKLRTLAVLFVFLVLGASGNSLNAQTIKIKLVNGRSGRPISNACVNTWVGTERKSAMAIPTGKDGVAWLHLTDEDAKVDTQNRPKSCGEFGVVHPVVKYADTIQIVAGYVVCLPHAPDFSWLAAMEFSTKQIVQQGIVTANTCGKAKASPEPGGLTIFVRPLSWREKLKE